MFKAALDKLITPVFVTFYALATLTRPKVSLGTLGANSSGRLFPNVYLLMGMGAAALNRSGAVTCATTVI